MSSSSGNLKNYEERIIRNTKSAEEILYSRNAGYSAHCARQPCRWGLSETILTDFPSLKPEDIQAAIAFAAASAEEDLPVPAIPQIR